MPFILLLTACPPERPIPARLPRPFIIAFDLEGLDTTNFSHSIYGPDKYPNLGAKFGYISDEWQCIQDSTLAIIGFNYYYFQSREDRSTLAGRVRMNRRLRAERKAAPADYLQQYLHIQNELDTFHANYWMKSYSFSLLPNARLTCKTDSFQINFGIQNGQLHGPYYQWSAKGHLSQTGQYQEGLETDSWQRFDTLGQLVKTEHYHEGELYAISQYDNGFERKRIMTYAQLKKNQHIMSWLGLGLSLLSLLGCWRYSIPGRLAQLKIKPWPIILWLFSGIFLPVVAFLGAVVITYFYKLAAANTQWGLIDIPFNLLHFLKYAYLPSMLFFLLRNRTEDLLWLTFKYSLVIVTLAYFMNYSSL